MAREGLLAGRVVALTGAGRGLGLLTASALVERDARVVANYLSEAPELFRLNEKYPDQVQLVQGDIADEDTARAVADSAVDRFGQLDVLVHNAAVSHDQVLVRMPVEHWDEVVRVNLRGAFLATKHSLQPMIRRRYGRMIYVSSLAAVIGNTGQAGYAASKAGLHGLSNTVSQEYSRFNIRSLVVAPGLLDVGLGAAVPPEIQREKLTHSLLGIGSAKSVAGTIAFLAGADADHINGTVVRIDGGIRY